MKQSKAIKIAAYAIVGALTMFSAVRVVLAASELDFTLHNKTGYPLHEVYVAAHGDKTWGEDIMGKDILPNGQDVHIVFSEGVSAPTYDLRVLYGDGQEAIWEGYDLVKITDITISFKDGTTWAEEEFKK
jgi:hypothetical protein